MSRAIGERPGQKAWDESETTPAALSTTPATTHAWEGRACKSEAAEPDLAAPDEGLPIYLREIGAVSLLTPDEEKMLAECLARGREARHLLASGTVSLEEQRAMARLVAHGEDARRRMIEANLRLVVSLARRYLRRGVPRPDRIPEGTPGLFRALGRYDSRQ